jgi:protoporphyrinogen oxidase
MENGNFLVMDPSRNPRYLFDTLVSPIGSIGDKLKMLSLRLSLMTKDLESNFEKEEISTLEYLYKWGFSKKIIDRFFIPFLGGIYLENELKTSSRMFEFVYRLFGTGDTVVPALGMQEIPNKMALRLGYSSIRLDEKVLEIEEGSVRTDKNVYPAKAIIFAGGSLKNFPGPQSRTLQNQFPNIHPRSALTLYFSAPKLPIKENIIVLNANPRNWVNTLAVMNSVSEAYSPEGIHLLSITLKNPNALDSNPKLIESVKEEMGLWFPETKNWKFIRS